MPQLPRPCQRFSNGFEPIHLIKSEQLQDGGRLDHTAESAGCPAGAQRIGIVDAVAARQRRCHQRHHLVAGVGSAWGPAQVQVPVNQLGQTQVQGQGGGKDQPGNVDQAVVVEAMQMRSGWRRGSIYWVLLFWGWFAVTKPFSQIQRSTRWLLQDADPTSSFGGLGFKWR